MPVLVERWFQRFAPVLASVARACTPTRPFHSRTGFRSRFKLWSNKSMFSIYLRPEW